MKTISTISDLVAIMKAAKNGGQFVTLYGEHEVRLNKFPTDGSERVRIDDSFRPTESFSVFFNFKEDYEGAMSKALGFDYKKSADENIETLVKGVLRRYKSTDNTCFVYIEKSRRHLCYKLNGEPMTDEQEAYMLRYMPKAKSEVVAYRNIGVKNISHIAIGGEAYEIAIGKAMSQMA